jgi:hypothetical protein
MLALRVTQRLQRLVVLRDATTGLASFAIKDARAVSTCKTVGGMTKDSPADDFLLPRLSSLVDSRARSLSPC